MKWFAHSLIGFGLVAPFGVPEAAIAVIGATAPDWMEFVARPLGMRLQHRRQTHYLITWVLALIPAYFISPWLVAFVAGGISHILADAMTISGVPFSPWSRSNFHLFGGRLKTGEPAEYFIGATVAIVGVLIAGTITGDWMPFIYDWGDYYNADLIDGAEWHDRRFKVF